MTQNSKLVLHTSEYNNYTWMGLHVNLVEDDTHEPLIHKTMKKDMVIYNVDWTNRTLLKGGIGHFHKCMYIIL